MKKSKGGKLCPSQQQAYDGLTRGLQVGSILYLWAGTGRGKTTILKNLQQDTGAAFLDLRDFLAEQEKRHPLSLEESFAKILRSKIRKHKIVLFDDIQLLDLGHTCHFYPRAHYFNAIVMALVTEIINNGRKVVFSTTGHLPESAKERSYAFGISKFTVEDYRWLANHWLGEKAAKNLDLEKVYRFAPKLNAHQLKAACDWVKQFKDLNTDSFIEYLRSQRLASNVDLEEVQHVNLAALKGVDDVIRSLEINVALPLENDELANKYKLRSKRGILLYGPPGTGKTTVGRALAHRLRGKFFLIDGTFIAGTDNFYHMINQVFETARDNSPSVIFIDDADAIFEDGEERGLYRYLLTMLDGLESESSARVCVMMTAMNVAHLPPALVRSGRVELWLEMKLPTVEARREILRDYVAPLPPELQPGDIQPILDSTEGFTGADLKRIVQDATAIFAYDKSSRKKPEPTLTYYLQALETVRENKNRYTEALTNAVNTKANTGFDFSRLVSPSVVTREQT